MMSDKNYQKPFQLPTKCVPSQGRLLQAVQEMAGEDYSIEV
jgi:hypothetical protein